ncbi:MAG: AmmeMemoRadiSam system protein A [Candidatus Cloacimonetes bacterium]|nr:AmmeMemoRadiSam system protein A [Candidatus Cloacimonadota bacterium]
MLTPSQQDFLLSLARRVIQCKLEHRPLDISPPKDAVFEQKCGAFVTLHKQDALRGCIGYVVGVKPLFDTIVDMAEAAAFRDPRFPPLSLDELPDITIEISILSPMTRVTNIDEILVGRDGLMIRCGNRSGLLLPQVAVEWHWNRVTFLEETCRKAGLRRDCWNSQDCIILRFTAEVFSQEMQKSV